MFSDELANSGCVQAGLSVRHKCLQAIMRMIYYASADLLQSVLTSSNVSRWLHSLIIMTYLGDFDKWLIEIPQEFYLFTVAGVKIVLICLLTVTVFCQYLTDCSLCVMSWIVQS